VGNHAFDNETLVEPHEFGVIFENATRTSEGSSIAQEMRYVVSFDSTL